jgi:glycosyltransferase involved in cell wall biosynthesis
MWKGQTVSVILMTYAEKDSIREVVDGFFATGVVDEVVVVNNNAQPGTAEEVARTAARQVFEPQQGYGYASRRGLAEARGDLLVLAEPDGTFLPRDVVKLLAYSDDCDAVFGTRTTREMIWHGANMGWFLKWGNWAVAKLIEVLFNTSHLSDVGCTYRLLSRTAFERVRDGFTVGSSHFGPELMLLVIRSGAKFVEVPVNYLPRVGVSCVTGDCWKAFRLGVQMILFILRFRLTTLGQPGRRTPRPAPRPIPWLRPLVVPERGGHGLLRPRAERPGLAAQHDEPGRWPRTLAQ